MPPPCPLCDKLANRAQLEPGHLVCEGEASVAFLGPWQVYAGYCVVVAREHVRELHDLAPAVRAKFVDEACRVAQAIEAAFRPRKLNVESLGNQVPHLHWHVFPRSEDDPERLKAVWLALERAEADPAERRRLETGPWPRTEIVERIRHALEPR